MLVRRGKCLACVVLLLTACGCTSVRNGLHNAVADSLDVVRADVSWSKPGKTRKSKVRNEIV